MLKIYTIPISYYCAKLRILLRHKQLQWQEELPPGGYGSAEYKNTVASGNLPALVDGNLMLADSEAIAEYLNDKYPDPPMLPEDLALRAKARELSRFHDTRLEPEIRVLFPAIPASARDDALIATQSGRINARLLQLAEILEHSKPWLNDEINLSDCSYPICFIWLDALSLNLDLSVEWPDAVVRYRKHIENYPTIADELREYGPVLAEWLNTRVIQ